jgi:HD superfamily phosphohydrolase YqeK
MDYTDINIDEIKSRLKECLTEERFLHSLGTMDMAVELAKKFDQNIDKAL